jgi:3-oxoacyl-[acyl-carrier protein] reductase
MTRLDGKVALVTGSSRGIGAAIAERFAAEGARVAVHGRDPAARAEVLARIEGSGADAIAVEGDVTVFADIEAMRRDVEHRLGPVDILVINAGGGVTPPGPLETIAEEGWRTSIDSNLTSAFLTLKSFLPGMRARKRGVIVTIASAAARKPHPNAPIAYAAAKAGVITLTQDAAAQAGPDGIRVNCIAPEIILTERNLERIPEALRKTLATTHPIQRLGTPQDVAAAALFLVSDQSAWISGVVLDVAGGAVLV